MNLKKKNYYLLLFMAVILLSSPHFFTTSDLWDGAILRTSMKIGDFEMLYAFFNTTNMTPYLIIYSFISYLTLIFNLEIDLVINLFSVLIIFFSASKIVSIFQHNTEIILSFFFTSVGLLSELELKIVVSEIK